MKLTKQDIIAARSLIENSIPENPEEIAEQTIAQIRIMERNKVLDEVIVKIQAHIDFNRALEKKQLSHKLVGNYMEIVLKEIKKLKEGE